MYHVSVHPVLPSTEVCIFAAHDDAHQDVDVRLSDIQPNLVMSTAVE